MKENNVEQWKPVVGYEGLYEVSDKGRVKSIERTVVRKDGRKCYYKEKILKAGLRGREKNKYFFVNLCKNGVEKPCSVHRLVAEAFIPNPDPERYTIINHKIEGAEGKLINTVENLEWCDIPYNNAYGTRNERIGKAFSKTVYQYEIDGKTFVQEWASIREVERQTGWSRAFISRCCRGIKPTAYGFIWSYTLL